MKERKAGLAMGGWVYGPRLLSIISKSNNLGIYCPQHHEYNLDQCKMGSKI